MAYRLSQRRFSDFKRVGDDNIRNLALITRRVNDRLDEMLKKREFLLRCIERCRRNETYSEKMDPFLVHWQLEPLETLDSASEHGSQIYFPSEGEPADGKGFMYRPPKIDHTLVCDCDPCVCEVATEEDPNNQGENGMNTPINKVS